MEETIPQETADRQVEAQATGQRAKRGLIVGLAAVGLLFVGMVALLVVLAVNAYSMALTSPGTRSPGEAVISLLRDAAIVLVAFESLIIGMLMIVLTLQLQSLISLLRDEVRPMLEALNETVATVRGTTRFVSHHIVSPTIQAASFLAGIRRVIQEIATLGKISKGKEGRDGEG